MANEEHLKLLKHGVEQWNNWRKQHWWVQPGLRGALLTGTDLSSANLSGAHLRRADLSGATLSRANLSYALQLYLRGARWC